MRKWTCVVIVLAAAGALVVAVPPPTADPAVLSRAETLISAGDLAAAETLLREQGATLDQPVQHRYSELLEIVRRTRQDFSLTAEDMLARIKASVPDATADDVARWQAEGALQHRTLDGQVRFFRREPGNLFRFNAAARARRTSDVAPAGYSFDLPAHLRRVLVAAERSGESECYPVQHRVNYTLTVKPNHPRLKPGSKVRCWLPFPQSYRQQRDVVLESCTGGDGAPFVAPNLSPQRTIYMEKTITDPAAPVEFAAKYSFVTSAYVPKLDPALVKPYDTSGDVYRTYTAERLPHIAFSPEVKAIVAEACGDEANPLERARRIFHWVSRNIPWGAEMEYSIIPNLSAKGLSARRGDCGVQGLVFVTLCRAAGIPARWQSGWQTQPGESNMHDWSEIYIEPWGWLPADASYGVQPGDDPRVRDFYCGGMEPYRMIVNLDYGRDLLPGKTSFRSEPADFQRGEVEIDGHNLYFDEWDWDFQVETVPLTRDLAAVQEALQAAVPRVLTESGIPGAVIAVGRISANGPETWMKAYGFQEIEPARRPMREDALFDLASMSKPIGTGTCLLRAVESSLVDLDDTVGTYLPEFATGNKAAVTVRQLMTHTSGMPPYLDQSQQQPLREKYGFPCRDATRRAIRELPLAQPPGKVRYSCLNAILCAELVERTFGAGLDEYAVANVFGPLGMKDTMYNPPAELDDRIVPTTRTAYGRGPGGFLRGQVHDPLGAMQAGVSGNAGLFSTAGDLTRFALMVLGRGELDGVRVLQHRTVEAMSAVQNEGAVNAKGDPDRRGLLWDIYYPDPGDFGADSLYSFGHTGYTGTAIRIYPQPRLFAMALANRTHPEDKGSAEELRRTVWRLTVEAWLGLGPDDRADQSSAIREDVPSVEHDGMWRLHIPTHFRMREGKQIDFVVHFHGGREGVEKSADAAGLHAALVTVQRPGLSSTYETPFRDDPALFQKILDGAMAELKRGGQVPESATVGRVCLTSFSAGFGAVRAILSTPADDPLIDGVVLADSLYCGYAEGTTLDDDNMRPFRRFAEAAARGQKLMLLTHSAQKPEGYASTTETADDLLRHVQAERRPAATNWPEDTGAYRPVTEAHAGGLHVLGFAGESGDDHGQHLRNMAQWYDILAAHLARP